MPCCICVCQKTQFYGMSSPSLFIWVPGFTSGHQSFLASALPAEPSHSPQPILILPSRDYLVQTFIVTTERSLPGT